MLAGTVATSNADRVLQWGIRRGVALAPTPRETPRIPAAEMFDLWSRLGRALAAPDLPVGLAQESKVEDLGLLGFAIVSAPTARRGLETFVKYNGLLNDTVRWEIHSDSRQLEIRHFASAPPALGVRLSHETAIAQLVGGVRQLAGGAFDPSAVSFRHPAPPDTRAHRHFFRCPLEFDAPFDRAVFARDLFDAEPRGANVALWQWLCSKADAELAAMAPRPLAARVRDEIARAMALGESLDMPVAAARLGTTERTLRRALSASSTTYRALVDDAKREETVRLLRLDSVSVTRAALDAGFSDPSAFTHACRRWFGQTPSDFAQLMRRRLK
jgi:AraC-like DNA-binding protein